jgi:hypothetical protein
MLLIVFSTLLDSFSQVTHTDSRAICNDGQAAVERSHGALMVPGYSKMPVPCWAAHTHTHTHTHTSRPCVYSYSIGTSNYDHSQKMNSDRRNSSVRLRLEEVSWHFTTPCRSTMFKVTMSQPAITINIDTAIIYSTFHIPHATPRLSYQLPRCSSKTSPHGGQASASRPQPRHFRLPCAMPSV